MNLDERTVFEKFLLERTSEILDIYSGKPKVIIKDSEDKIRLLACLVAKWVQESYDGEIQHPRAIDRHLWREKYFKICYENVKFDDSLTFKDFENLVYDGFDFHCLRHTNEEDIWKQYDDLRQKPVKGKDYIEIDDIFLVKKSLKYDWSQPSPEDAEIIKESREMIENLQKNGKEKWNFGTKESPFCVNDHHFKNDGERVMASYALAASYLYSARMDSYKKFGEDREKLGAFFYKASKDFKSLTAFMTHINTAYSKKWTTYLDGKPNESEEGKSYVRLSDDSIVRKSLIY